MIYSDAMAYLNRECKLCESQEEFWAFTSGGLGEFYKIEANPKKGAEELLKHLKESGIKIALASATTMNEIKTAIEFYGLDKYFDCVFSCADIGIGKDRPDVYLLSSEALGLPVDDLCVVEDSYIALETAKKAGFQTIGVFDKLAFGQDRLKLASDIYMREGQDLSSLIGTLELKK
jgi:HAD superfamily hydrolase (TIGR01509 family)